MNKTAVKNFAVWAREKLISDIKYKAQTIGITENGIAEKLPQSTKDMQFFDIGTKNYAEVAGDDIAKRNTLVDVIKSKERSFKTYQKAFDNVVEESRASLEANLEEFPALALSIGEKLLGMLGLSKQTNLKML